MALPVRGPGPTLTVIFARTTPGSPNSGSGSLPASKVPDSDRVVLLKDWVIVWDRDHWGGTVERSPAREADPFIGLMRRDASVDRVEGLPIGTADTRPVGKPRRTRLDLRLIQAAGLRGLRVELGSARREVSGYPHLSGVRWPPALLKVACARNFEGMGATLGLPDRHELEVRGYEGPKASFTVWTCLAPEAGTPDVATRTH